MIKSKIKPECIFSFTTVQYEDVLNFQNIIHYCLEQSLFTDDLKLADVAPAYLHIKRNPKLLKIIVDWRVFFQIYPRYMKDASMI